MYRKAIPGIDNSHRGEFQSSSGGASLFLQLMVSSRGLLLHFYRQSRDLIQFMHVGPIYIPRSCPLSFDDMKVRGEQVSLVSWHNRNSSSQGPPSLLFFAHPLIILHPFHRL